MSSTMDLMNNTLTSPEEKMSNQPFHSIHPLVPLLQTKWDQLVIWKKFVLSYVSSLMKALMTDELTVNFSLRGMSCIFSLRGRGWVQAVECISSLPAYGTSKIG